jgi:hypothetical protein
MIPLHYLAYIEGAEGQSFRPILFLRNFLGEGSRLIIGQRYSELDFPAMRIGGLYLLGELLPYQSCYLVDQTTLFGVCKAEIFGDSARFPGVEAYLNEPETRVTPYGDILNTGEDLFLVSIGIPPRLRLLVTGDWKTLYAYEWRASPVGVAEVYTVQPFDVRDDKDAVIVYNSALDGLSRVRGVDYEGSQGLAISRISTLSVEEIPPTASMSPAMRNEFKRRRPDLNVSTIKAILNDSGLVRVLQLLMPEAEAQAPGVEQQDGKHIIAKEEVPLDPQRIDDGHSVQEIQRVPYEIIIQTRYGVDGVARKVKFYIPVDLDFDPAQFERQLEGIAQLPVGHKGIIRFNG